MSAYDLIFEALGDPTRRKMLDMIRGRPRTVGELTSKLPITQPAVSQHLKVLRNADLVAVKKEGTRRIYSLNRQGMKALRSYTDAFWGDILDAFGQSVSETEKKK